MTDLGQFDPVAMNSSAQIIGYATTEDSQGGTPSGTPEVYTTGSGITDLSSLIGSGGLVEGINDAGLIVGALDQTNGGAFAYWPNVGLFDLTNDVGTLTTGSGINNNDLIVGAYPNFGGAFIYQLGALSPETVLNPGALYGGLFINNSGQVTGNFSTNGGGAVNAFAYTPGSGIISLTNPLGVGSMAEGINNLGQVVGSAGGPSLNNYAFLYTAGSAITNLGVVGSDIDSDAHAINDSGQVVGDSSTDPFKRAFVYTPGSGMQDLNTLVFNPGWTLTSASAINNAGQIAVIGSNSGSLQHGFLLTPPPPVGNNTNIWVSTASDKWEVGSDWSSTVAPSWGDADDLIANGVSKTVTIDASTATNFPNSMTINSLTVSAPAGSTNTLVLSNAGTVSTRLVIRGAVTLGGGGVIIVTNSDLEVDSTGGVPAGVDAVLVGVSGSGNTLTINDGGALYDNLGFVGSNSTSSGNSVLVAGTGSVWSNQDFLDVGSSGAGNSMVVSNGGAVYDFDGSLGFNAGSSNNTGVVTGAGSAWFNQNFLDVGRSGSSNLLQIAGGTVVATNVTVGFAKSATNNVLVVSGGNLFVTNGIGNAVLVISRVGGKGTLLLSGGAVTVSQLVLTNGANSVFTFNAGTLNSVGTFVTNNQVFVVGDGTDAATFQLDGGVHNFNNGLEISNNALLAGCGTINGNVTIDPGGTVLADCGGMLIFTGSVTNNGTMRAIDGSILEADNTVVNNGTIDIINGATNFHGAFVNNGTVLDASSVKISQGNLSGADFIVKIPSVTGHTYQLQFTSSLTPASWMNTGASQAGTGGVLTLTDTGGAGNPQRFYRVSVTAP